jgi:hypothetical protein
MSLRFAPGARAFKLLQLTDLHYCGDVTKDSLTTALIAKLIRYEQPDFVVFSGDLVSGDSAPKWHLSQLLLPSGGQVTEEWELLHGSSASGAGASASSSSAHAGRHGWFAARWAEALSALNGTLPYAVALGNHDVRGDWGAAEILSSLEHTQRNSHTQRVPAQAAPNAPFNYYIELYDDDRETTGDVLVNPVAASARASSAQSASQAPPRPPRRLWFLNSGDVRCAGRGPWGCVPPPAVAWAQKSAATSSSASSADPASFGRDVAFVHIPLPQFRPEALTALSGAMREGVSCASSDSGVAAWAQTAGVAGIFSGHDHGNDYTGQWLADASSADDVASGAPGGAPGAPGLMMAYGRNSGYGGYDPGMARGARVLEFYRSGDANGANVADAADAARGFATWVRLEDGSVLREGRAFEALAPPPAPPRRGSGADHAAAAAARALRRGCGSPQASAAALLVTWAGGVLALRARAAARRRRHAAAVAAAAAAARCDDDAAQP